MNARPNTFGSAIADVAAELLGDPNRQLSSATEWRFGSNGSLSVNLAKGTWYDHEAKEGGGVLDLVARQCGLDKRAAAQWLSDRGLIDTAQPRREIARYSYRDELGCHLFDVVRFDPKDFRQQAANGAWSLKGVRRVLYRLPELLEKSAELVLIAEGEKDVDRLIALGFAATCNSGGAGKWADAYSQSLAGRRCIVIPDNDDAGRDHAKSVVKSLRNAGATASTLYLENLPPKGDVCDWLASGKTKEDLQAAILTASDDVASDPDTITATPFVWRDPLSIPPRPWVYGRHMIRKQVSVTVAPGGVGKSSLTLVEALAMVTGRQLLGEWVTATPVRAWVYNLEDPRDEMDRRVIAAMMHHRIAADDVADRLFIDTGRERALCTAVEVQGSVTIVKPEMDALAAEITRRGIDVLIVDPFVSSHRVSENASGAIDTVAKEWARLADRCNCAVELVHHTRKTNGTEATSEDGRGSSALLAAARSGRVLNKMNDEMKDSAGVKADLATYFGIDRDKANLAPAGNRTWVRMASVDLGQGDSVGVAESWTWPDTFDGVSVTDLLRVQQAIEGKQPRYSDQSGDEWVGVIVAATLGLDATADKKRIKRMIEAWLKSGALVKGTVFDSNREKRPCIEVGEWATE